MKFLKSLISRLLGRSKSEPTTDKLYVIAPLFNPKNYKSRYRLYNHFEAYMLANPDVILCTIECTFRNQDPVVKNRGKNHLVITVNSDDELWLKENLINIAVNRLPAEAKYICTIDADLSFANPTWAKDTIALLQKYPVAQLFSDVVYLNNTYVRSHEFKSLVWGWNQGASFMYNGQCIYNHYCKLDPTLRQGYGWHGAPGGAWAYRIETFREFGGLYDCGIVGSGDSYSCFALFGIICSSIRSREFNYSTPYKLSVVDYVAKVSKVVKGNVGLLTGTVYHNYHGDPKNRNYWYRNNVMAENQFDPYKDLVRNGQGLIQLSGNKPKLKTAIEEYFASRQEDSE